MGSRFVLLVFLIVACYGEETEDFVYAEEELFRMVSEGRLDEVKEALKDKSDEEVQRMRLEKTNETLILRSIDAGKMDMIKYFETRGLSVLDKGGLFNQPGITRAVMFGHLEVFRYCLEKGASLEVESEKGHTLLHWAGYGGNAEIAEELLKRGVKVDEPDKQGHTALLSSSILGRAQIMKLLLEHGATPFVISKNTNCSALSYALSAYAKNPEMLDVIKLFIEKHADLDVFCERFGTPVSAIVKNGYVELMRWVLAHPRGLLELEGKEPSILLEATEGNHTEMALLLLEKGANVHEAPVLVAAVEMENEVLVQEYLARGSSTTVSGKWGNTTSIAAAAVGRLDWLKLFVEKAPAYCCKVSMSHDSALHLSSWNGHTDVVEFLLSKNSTSEFVNGENLHGFTPLILSSRNGHPEIVKLLLEKGADVSALTKMGSSSLHLASKYGHLEVVQLLVSAGADVSLQNGANQSSLEIAQLMKQDKVAEFLENLNANKDEL